MFSPASLTRAAAVLLLSAAFSSANSATVRLDFTGFFDSCSLCYALSAPPGSQFTGFVVYDTAGATDMNSTSTYGDYVGQVVDAGLSFGTYIGTEPPSSSDNVVAIENNAGSPQVDAITIRVAIAPLPIGGQPPSPTWMWIRVIDSTATSLSSDVLPLSFSATDPVGSLQIPLGYYGTLTSATLSVVPLPAAATLLLGGLGLLVPVTRRRQVCT